MTTSLAPRNDPREAPRVGIPRITVGRNTFQMWSDWKRPSARMRLDLRRRSKWVVASLHQVHLSWKSDVWNDCSLGIVAPVRGKLEEINRHTMMSLSIS
jgi:hypothetical protein